MAVRIEEAAFGDARFTALGELAGYNEHEALGRMARLWRYCTQRNAYIAPEAIIRACLGPKGVEALIDADLGERTPEGIRIRGTSGRVEWLEEARNGSSAGGKARAATAERGADGKMLPRQNGESIQRNPAESTAGKTLDQPAGVQPPAPSSPLVLAPAPVQLQEREIGAGELRAHEVEQIGFSQNGVMGGSAQVAMRKLMPIHRDELEVALKAGGSSWAYTAKVLISMRAEAAKPASLAIRDGPSRHLTKQDQAIANNLAAVEQFNAQRR
jgi:hypothetical protein